MNDEKMSVKDLLKQIAEEIGQIRVPVEMADEISRPLCKNLFLLHQCIDALKDEPAPDGEEDEDNVRS